MRLFDRRPTVTVQEFCQDFYDANIFYLTPDSKYMPSPMGVKSFPESFWGGIVEALHQSDPAYASVEPNSFATEWAALRLEVFGIAWSHLFKHDAKITLPQSEFTRLYLERIGRTDAWDAMVTYSEAVAKSGYWQALAPYGYFQKGRPENMLQAVEMMQGEARMKMFDKLVATGANIHSVARIATRIGTSSGWEKSIGLAPVASHFSDRLAVELESDGRDYIMHTIRMLYEGTQTMTERVVVLS